MRNARDSGSHGKGSLGLWHDGNPLLGEAKIQTHMVKLYGLVAGVLNYFGTKIHECLWA